MEIEQFYNDPAESLTEEIDMSVLKVKKYSADELDKALTN
jgi:hypothetical protein